MSLVRHLMGVDYIYDEESGEERTSPLNPPLMSEEQARNLIKKYENLISHSRNIGSFDYYIAAEIFQEERKVGKDWNDRPPE